MSKFEFISSGKKANIEGALLLAKSPDLYVEEKFDGSRFGFELDEFGKWHAWSRGGIDRIQNVPYLVEELDMLHLKPGTVLDCEVIVMHSDRRLRWELSRSVMGTNTFNPEAKKAILLIFDIQHYGDKDLRTHGYLERRDYIKRILPNTVEHDTYKQHGRLAYPRAWSIKKIASLWDEVVNDGHGEGVMVKSNAIKIYGKDWNKVKKEHTIDAFILSATQGKGKYAGQIGTLEVAVFNGGVIWPIGKVSNVGDDDNRKLMTDLALKRELRDKVIEIKFNEVTKNFKLRHGRFTRWREDKPMEDCLLEQLEKIK